VTASFGSIPHAELLKSVTRRIVDRRVLHLIKMWLDCPVEETDDRGRKTRTTEARNNRRGIPQGSALIYQTALIHRVASHIRTQESCLAYLILSHIERPRTHD